VRDQPESLRGWAVRYGMNRGRRESRQRPAKTIGEKRDCSINSKMRARDNGITSERLHEAIGLMSALPVAFIRNSGMTRS
jgi:hypothetical protein